MTKEEACRSPRQDFHIKPFTSFNEPMLTAQGFGISLVPLALTVLRIVFDTLRPNKRKPEFRLKESLHARENLGRQ